MSRKVLFFGVTFFLMLLWVTSGISHEMEDWLTKFDWSGKEHYQKKLIIQEVNGKGEFELTLASESNKLLTLFDETNFEIEILPVDDPPDFEVNEGAGVYVDGNFFEHHHEQLEGEDSVKVAEPPPLLIKIHFLGEEEPSRFVVWRRNFPETIIYSVVNAGHYRSMVLRRTGSGSSYAKFYHHHGDWNEHVLYEGWFSRCTYAYDCYPNHSIPSHWTSRGDEGTEYRGDCYGRCP